MQETYHENDSNSQSIWKSMIRQFNAYHELNKLHEEEYKVRLARAQEQNNGWVSDKVFILSYRVFVFASFFLILSHFSAV